MRFSHCLTFLCTFATVATAADLQPTTPVVGFDMPTHQDAVLFMTGFIERLTGKNDLVAINECFKNSTDIAKQVYTIIDDLMKRDKFDIEAAMIALTDMIKSVDEKLSKCSAEMKPELERIDAWIKN